jgi:hypothetical protein
MQVLDPLKTSATFGAMAYKNCPTVFPEKLESSIRIRWKLSNLLFWATQSCISAMSFSSPEIVQPFFQSTEIAGYSKRAYMEILGRYNVPIFAYSPEDLRADLGL